MSLSTETINAEAVKAELDALDPAYKAEREAARQTYLTRRKTLKRLLDALEAESGKE